MNVDDYLDSNWLEHCIIVAFKSTSTGCMQGTYTCSLNVKHLQVNASQSKYDMAALGAPRWPPPLLRQVSKRSLVTHCCYTQSRLHKLLPLITLNPFNRKSDSEMSWTRLSCRFVGEEFIVSRIGQPTKYPFRRYFRKKSFVRLCKKITGFLERASGD